jgi:fatty acid desaturase
MVAAVREALWSCTCFPAEWLSYGWWVSKHNRHHGLNYQIEHHLFPSMPRPGLRRAQAIVRAHCREHGLTYHESSILGSYAQVLRHLHTVGVPLGPATDAG